MNKIIDGQTIIAGDALNELSNIESDSIDLIVADPPYNLNKNYGNSSDNLNINDFLEFSEKWITEAWRILNKTGSIYVFMGMKLISYIYQLLEDKGFCFNSWITWHYTQGIGKKKGFSPRHDDILMFTKSEKDFIFNLDNIRVPQKYYRNINNMRGANPGNVWTFSHVHYCKKERQPHPTQKPEGVYERIILASSNNGDTVLDPFCGSGTCLRVCQQTGRNGIGIELNEEYCNLIESRLNTQFVGFDSIDERMLRCPNDLNDNTVRIEYLTNHIKWFLDNHQKSIPTFLDEVKNKYLIKMIESGQTGFFQQYGYKI